MTKLTDFLNMPVNQTAPSVRGAQVGDLFGIEVECEGKNVGLVGPDILDSWAPHRDGSLREWQGYQPCEWVFNGPANYKHSVARVNQLFDYFDKNKAKLHLSNRTSIHVHFNMGDKTTYQLVNTYVLFTILEDLLDAYCGEERNGNLFCLSSRHAEGQLKWVEEAIFKNYRFKYNDNWRYCSLNLASLNKFGTIEFRGMRGLDKREDLLAWLEIINELVNYSCYKMKNPVDLIESISAKRPIGFIKEIFSKENFLRLTRGIDEDQIDNSVYEGLRLVQMLVYKVGTEFDQVRLRGKDFWAGFQDDKEPVRDMDPKDILGGRAAKAPRPFGDAPNPDPFRRQVRVQMEPQQAQAGEPGMIRNPWFVDPQPAPVRGWDEIGNLMGEQPLVPQPAPVPGWDEPQNAGRAAPPPDAEWVRQAKLAERQRINAIMAERERERERLLQQARDAGNQIRQEGIVAAGQNGINRWAQRLNEAVQEAKPKKKLPPDLNAFIPDDDMF